MTLTLIVRRDRKGRWWLTKNEVAPFGGREQITVEIPEVVGLQLECILDAASDGQQLLL